MNYYEHHIGDYDEATSHLTACEDGIYSRLIRKYMAKEQPFPDDLPALQRLVRARSREEKNAVASILTEFFYLVDGFWHQKTCDETIEKFRSGEPEREVKKANEDNRLKRHREERAALFRVLTEAGEHAPWNTPMSELRDLVKRVAVTAPETPLPPLPATAPATPATATQAPLPTTHYPSFKTEGTASGSTEDSRGGESDRMTPPEISIALIGWERDRHKAARGISASNIQVIELAELSITPDELRRAYDAAVADRLATEDPNPVNAGFVKVFVDKARNPPKPRPKQDDWHRSDEGIKRKAKELGVAARAGWGYDQLKDAVWDAIRTRERQGAAA